MTIESFDNTVRYDGDGVSLLFAIDFQYYQTTDIKCRLLRADGSEDTPLFTVSEPGPQGGTLTITEAAPPAGDEVFIWRDTAALQSSAYEGRKEFPALLHEKTFDRKTMTDQDQDAAIDRSLRFAPWVDPIGWLPDPEDLFGKLLTFDENGNPIAVPFPTGGDGSGGGGLSYVEILQLIDQQIDTSFNEKFTAVDASITSINADLTDLYAQLALKAPLASPALTGVPTAPTAPGGTKTTQISTTAFVASAIDAARGASILVAEQYPSGTDAGGSVAGAWYTRPLNTLKHNAIAGGALNGNKTVIPAGTYEVDGWATATEANEHRVRLRDVTNNVTLVAGLSARTDANDDTHTPSLLRGAFTIPAAIEVELQHRVAASKGVFGWGKAAAFGEVEVYASLFLRRLNAISDANYYHDDTGTYAFGGQIAPQSEALAPGAAVALNMAGPPVKTLAVDGTAPTVTVTPGVPNTRCELIVTQGASPQAVAWAGVDIWVGGAVPTLGATAGDRDTVILAVHPDGIVEGSHLGTAS